MLFGIDGRCAAWLAPESAQPPSRRDVGEPGRYVHARRRRREWVEGKGLQEGGGGAPGARHGDHRRQPAQGAFLSSGPFYHICVDFVSVFLLVLYRFFVMII